MDPVTSFLCLCNGVSLGPAPTPTPSPPSGEVCRSPGVRPEYRSDLAVWYCVHTCHNRGQDDCLQDSLAGLICICNQRRELWSQML